MEWAYPREGISHRKEVVQNIELNMRTYGVEDEWSVEVANRVRQQALANMKWLECIN